MLLFSPIAIIVSTNSHLFYDVYLMEPIDCQAVVVASDSIDLYCLFDFFILIFLYCKIVLLTVCRFSVYLIAFDYEELKGLLTYLLM